MNTFVSPCNLTLADRLPLLDDDLWFCAEQRWMPPKELQALRKQAIEALNELKATVEFGHRQAAQPANSGHSSPRTDLPPDHVDVVGRYQLSLRVGSWHASRRPAPPYGIFPVQPGRPITMDEVLDGWQSHNFAIMEQLKPALHDAVLLEQSEAPALHHRSIQPSCVPYERVSTGTAGWLRPLADVSAFG